MGSYHPTFVTDRLVDTINFYEDNFGFVPVIELENYVLLEKCGAPDIRLALVDVGYKDCIRNVVGPVNGLMLNMPVSDIGEAYDFLYMEGLPIVKDLSADDSGRKNFILSDPNGVLINVIEPETNPA